jgi:hypothetical protein
MATAAAIAFSALTSKSVRVGHDVKHLSSSKFNVVHVQRPQLAVPDHPSKLLSTAGLQVGCGWCTTNISSLSNNIEDVM